MGYQRGRNNGITGTLDLPGQSAKYILTAYGFEETLQAGQISASGRGDGYFGSTWLTGGDGNLILQGRVRLDGRPAPSSWIGEAGSVVLQFHTDGTTVSKQTVNVLVVGQTFTQKEKDQDVWTGALICKITDSPSWTGFGDAISAGSVSHADKETWEGMSKGIDPNGLQSGATQRYLIYGITDTDAAEMTKIAALIAAATTPVTNLKLRLLGWNRVSSGICVATYQWGLTDTQEDVINPATATVVDPNELQTGGTVAAINATPTIPTISGQTVVERTTTTKELNDNNTLKVTEFGNRSTKADIENPGTWTNLDASDIKSTGLQTSVYANGGSVTAASVPSGLQTTTTKIETINADRKQVTYEFAKNTSKQEIEFPGTFTNIDPSDLENTGRQTSVYAATDSPTAAADLSASKLYKVGTTIRFINPDQKEVVYDYARQTNAQKVTNQAGYVFTDPSGLESKEIAAAINDSTPTALSALTADRGTKAVYLNPDNILYTQELGVRTTEQDITYLKSTAKRASSLGAEDRRFVVEITTSATTGSPANPDSTNLSFRGTETYRITDTKYVHAHEFAPFTVEEEIEAEGTESNHEESAVSQPIFKEEKETVFDTNATAPTAPAHSGMECVRVSTRKSSKTGYRHTYFYDYRTNAAKLAADKTIINIDQSAIETEITTAAVVTAGAVIGSPSAPTVVTGTMVLVSYTDLATSNPAYSLRVYRWGLVTNTQKIEYGGTVYGANEQTADETTTATVVASTLSGDGLRDSLWGDYKDDATFRELQVQSLVPGKYVQKITTTSRDKIIHAGSVHTFEDSVTAIPMNLLSGTPTYGLATAFILIGELSAVVSGGAGATAGRIVPIVFWRTKGSFTIERRYSLALTDLDSKHYSELIGHTNSAEFCGHDAHHVMYEGASVEYGVPGGTDAGIAIFTYHFATDSKMFFSSPYIMTGWTDSAVLLGDVGIYPAATIISSAYLDPEILWPDDDSGTTADFGDFLT